MEVIGARVTLCIWVPGTAIDDVGIFDEPGTTNFES